MWECKFDCGEHCIKTELKFQPESAVKTICKKGLSTTWEATDKGDIKVKIRFTNNDQ